MSGVTVVIPTWNRRDLLEQLLDDLGRQTQAALEILVVDNGSTDGSSEAATARGARVIQMGFNAGFCRAVNRGLQEVRSPWVAVVNNDVRPAPDWLARLLAAAQGENIWFATGKLLDAARQDVIDGTFDVICRGGCAWRAGHGRADTPEWGAPRTVRFAPFTAVLFRAALFEAVGWLDERFESYLEDVDFGLRSAMKGYEGVYVPDAVAYHVGSASLGRWHPEVVRRIARNQMLLVAKHYPRQCLLRYGWAVLVAQLLWGVVALRHGAGFAFLRGKVEALRQFRAHRSAELIACGETASERLSAILEQSEAELLDLQRRGPFDAYWKLYFTLT